ncbi:MAG: PAS domain S-box protein [Bacteroidota bacterium]
MMTTIIIVSACIACLIIGYTLRAAVQRPSFGEGAEEEGQNEFKQFIESSSDAVIVTDERQSILYFNNAAESILGYTAEEVCGKHLSQIIPDPIRRIHESFVEQFGNESNDSRRMGNSIYVRAQHASGKDLSLEITISRYMHNGKKHYAGIIRDYTERSRVESELHRLSVAVEQSSASIIITDPEGTIEYVNKGFTETTGYTLEEARGQNPRILKSGLTPSETFVDLWKTLKAGKRWSGTFINKKKSGEHYWQQATLSPIFNKAGHLINFVGVIEDVSHRKMKEEILRANEQRYRTFFEDDVSGAYIAKPDGQIIVCNKAFKQIFELDSCSSAEEKISLQSFYENKGQWFATLDRLQREHRLDNFRERLRTQSGNNIHVVENLVGTVDEHGELREINGYLLNETQLKLVENQLLQSQKMESVGTLAAGVAHDFNNVLAIILSASEVLRMELENEPNYLKFVDVITQSAKRGSAIAKEILLFSRRDSIQSVPISVKKAINQILNFLEHSLPKTITLELSIDESRDFEILGDYALIEQMYLNLSINAHHAMPNGGKLLLGAQLADKHVLYQKFAVVTEKEFVELTVSDTGTGIEETMLDRIFDPFFTTKKSEKGTGLGLSIVHGIVTGLNGFINVESAIGKGTTFKIYLPISDTVHEETKDIERFTPSMHHESILLVDDEQEILDIMSEALSLYGYKIKTVQSVDAAIDVLQQSSANIDVVITDLAMPGRTGDELIQEMKISYPDKKILVLSGYDDPVISTKIMNLGAYTFLHKPIEIGLLLKSLETILMQKAQEV